MKKIATPNELVSELENLIGYAKTGQPSREKLAFKLDILATGLMGKTAAKFSVGDKIKINENSKDYSKYTGCEGKVVFIGIKHRGKPTYQVECPGKADIISVNEIDLEEI